MMHTHSPAFNQAMPGKTPAKVHHVKGLLTLSSSNKKKNISKCYKKANKNTLIPIRFTHGLVKRESFIKFAVNVFQYLLYDNDIIPIPFQYFDRIIASQTASSMELAKESQLKRMSLLSEMFTSLNGAFTFLCQLFDESTLEHSHIAMCFGDSIRFAKEVFTLDFSKLNIYSTFADKGSLYAASTRLLTLENIISMFYQKLLNEVFEENTQPKELSSSKSKATSVIFTVKINSKDVEKYESFNNFKRTDKNLTNFPYYDRLGCTITKTTTFKLSHTPKQPVVFEIFNSNDYPVEEIIEEKLLDEDEEKLTKNTLATLNESSESLGSNSGEQLTQEQQQQLQEEEKLAESKNQESTPDPEYIWVQINAPIRCFSKM